MYDSTNLNVVTISQDPTEKSVILTFDDGPGRFLPQILDVLKQEQVPAVFFWQSRLLYPKRPWKRVLSEGHLIGTHTTKHINLEKLTYDEQYQEVKNSVMAIEKVTGTRVKYFRPPFGRFNNDTIKAAKKLSLTPVIWRVASMDWELKDNPEQILNNIVENLEDGAVILLHELKQTLDVLPRLIDAIREKGYNFKLL
ncbi:polysaccharide deacetylase family protein [Paenisporosarcina sp. TG20]|uniref:polysaccharide deacetylase family protein n=1 Tax=Paenisporosarcina sp. TG20 TaxID=1211706 RepID=UPI0002DBA176|nr:polysaccharide deacetylase family protein [Paenisporosarcina sp. TG20]